MRAAQAIIERLTIMAKFEPARLLRSFEAARFDAELALREAAARKESAGMLYSTTTTAVTAATKLCFDEQLCTILTMRILH
jgi:hypothetical protein